MFYMVNTDANTDLTYVYLIYINEQRSMYAWSNKNNSRLIYCIGKSCHITSIIIHNYVDSEM